jgi:hypothetical protein
MNQRIRELAEQAQKVVGYTDGGYTELKELDQEKFAELIIQDCVATMYKHGEAYAHPSAGFYQARTFSEAILKHFGVEQ